MKHIEIAYIRVCTDACHRNHSSPGHHLILLIISYSLEYMQLLSACNLVGNKLVYNHSGKYLTQSNGIYYFIRRVPTGLSDQYKSNKIEISLRTRNPSRAYRSARSITQRLNDY